MGYTSFCVLMMQIYLAKTNIMKKNAEALFIGLEVNTEKIWYVIFL